MKTDIWLISHNTVIRSAWCRVLRLLLSKSDFIINYFSSIADLPQTDIPLNLVILYGCKMDEEKEHSSMSMWRDILGVHPQTILGFDLRTVIGEIFSAFKQD